MKEINASTLKMLSGEAAFKRGKAYYRDNTVESLIISGSSITADVQGSTIYHVQLKHTSTLFEGSCNCPASDNIDFCKHCVAVGLVYLEQVQAQEELKNSQRPDLLLNFLLTHDKVVLADILSKLIHDEPLLLDKWMLKAEVAAGQLSSKEFKKRITKAIPYNRHIYRYPQVRNYFSRIDLLVDQLTEFLPLFKPNEALTLINYALARINKALETVDDSGGFRYYSLENLHQMHIQALGRTGWPPEKQADYLLDIFSKPQLELYPKIPEEYAHILGEPGMNYFIEQLQAQWDSLPPLTNRDNQKTSLDYPLIREPLLATARLRGDLDSEILLLAKTAVSSHELLNLSKLCLSHDRLDESAGWFEQAKQKSRGDSNWSITEQEIAILCYQKQYEQVLTRLWKIFEESPHLATYRRLCDMAQLAQSNTDWHQCALKQLTSGAGDKSQAEIDTVAEIHLEEQQPEQALAWAQQHRLSPQLLLEVIHTNKNRPQEILPLYIRLVEFNINRANNEHYRDAIELMGEAEEAMEEAQLPTWQEELRRLHNRHKAKRNFRKWLQERFPEVLAVD